MSDERKPAPDSGTNVQESAEIAALRAKVALMREMGVLEADGVKLGPLPAPPKPEETKEEMLERLAKVEQRKHDIMFAASGVKPVLRRAK